MDDNMKYWTDLSGYDSDTAEAISKVKVKIENDKGDFLKEIQKNGIEIV